MAGFPYRRAHFIGIGGVGMSAVAKLLRESGVAVTGSDENVYPPMSNVLRDEGFDYRTPYAAANLPADADLIVIGKNAKLVPESNPEVAAAFASGARIVSFADVLAMLGQGRETIVVAGSFGKTTSVSLMSHALLEAGLDPSFMIGAAPLSPPTAAHVGTGELFVVEGDEYPASNTDDRSKFLLYDPAHLLLTPLAHDHVNVFPTVESYLEPFAKLVRMVRPRGTILASTGGELSERFLASLERPLTTYGIEKGEWQAGDIQWGERTRFTLRHNGCEVARVETGQLGLHNIENMVGVGAFLLMRELMSAEAFVRAMGSFKGIRRRLDRKSDRTSVALFEGFGSSYDKAKSAIAAMKQHFPQRRLIVVFEPHTFSWRNRATLHWYDDVFDGVQKTFVFQPAEQGAGTHAQATQTEIVTRIAASGADVTAIDNSGGALAAIGEALLADDAVLFLTSGNLGGLIEDVPKLAEARFPGSYEVSKYLI
jgi:UDP-N-acetylmuramate: L-alanyl-gamma-D-glutamyl-meso-diaminopimelate ligase